MKPLLKLFLFRKEAATPQIVDVLLRPGTLRGSTKALADWLPSLLVPPKGAMSSTAEGWRGLIGKVAFLWGARDTTTPPEQGQALADLSKGLIIFLPDVGHIPQIEDTGAFYAALLQSLQQFGPPAP